MPVLMLFILMASLISAVYALGPGEYGLVAYSAPNKVFQEARVSTTKSSTEGTALSAPGVTVYYGSYARNKVSQWLGQGYRVYLVHVSSGNSYTSIMQITGNLP
jgi:hypothetical protein